MSAQYDFPNTRAQGRAEVAEVERVKDWICHNGGLLDVWAKEWNPNRSTLTAYLRKRLDAALQEPTP